MSCDAQAIIDDATCVECFVPPGMQAAALLVMLCAIRDGDTAMSCDPQAIIDEAECLQCMIPPGLMGAALLSVACAIAQSGGGGGGGGCANTFGVVDPIGVVTPTCLGQFYSNTVFDSLWQATGLTNADWKQWV